MARFNPFPRVDARYGAPMGRHGCPLNWDDDQRLYVKAAGGRDGYDRGGAYWGLGQPVFAVHTRGGDFCVYTRASNAARAIAAVHAMRAGGQR